MDNQPFYEYPEIFGRHIAVVGYDPTDLLNPENLKFYIPPRCPEDGHIAEDVIFKAGFRGIEEYVTAKSTRNLDAIIISENDFRADGTGASIIQRLYRILKAQGREIPMILVSGSKQDKPRLPNVGWVSNKRPRTAVAEKLVRMFQELTSHQLPLAA